MRLKELREAKRLKVAEAKKILEGADPAKGLTDEQQASHDAILADIARLDKSIKAAEAVADLDRAEPALPETPESTALQRSGTRPAESFVGRYSHLPQSAHVVPANRSMSQAHLAAFGDFLVAVRRASQPNGHVDNLLRQASLGANETVNEDGGFLVERDLADALLRRTFQIARIASRARRIPISASSNGVKINALKDDSRATGSRWGGVQIYHIGEGEALTPTRPRFRQMDLRLKKMAGLLYATDELLQDATALAAVISEAFPLEFAFTLDDVMFEGAGAATGLGFMNAGCKVTVGKEAGQAAKTIVYENITKMFARLPPASIPNSEWWVNQDCMPALMALHQVIGTGGVPVYLPPGGLSSSPFGTLLGRPVMPIEYCNTVGTEGDLVLCDPTTYVMIDKGDIQYATSIHVAFLTNEQAFRFVYRYDGQPVDDKPITPFKGTDKQSPFVTLATRA